MTVSVARYYKREKITLDCTILTPMFLGDADQQAALSTAPIKAALRYWWRVSGVHNAKNSEELFKKESCLFGSADEKFGKSKVSVSVEGGVEVSEKQFRSYHEINHPEVKYKRGKIPSLLYLANMGILNSSLQPKFKYIPTQQSFKIHLLFPENLNDHLLPTLHLFQNLGSLGARSRKGWGSVNIPSESTNKKIPENIPTQPWENLFVQDYPHGIGKDEKGVLLWESKNTFSKWEEAMHILAESYVKLRTNDPFIFPRISPPHKFPQPRHLLGYPVGKTHRVKDWPNSARSASELRFTLKPRENRLKIVIFHVPHLFDRSMIKTRPLSLKEEQIKIWKQVHNYFDQSNQFQRATL